MKIKAPPSQDQNKRDNMNANGTSGNKTSYMVLPYVKGLSEGMKNVCSKHGVQVHYKGGDTIKSLLMALKDKDHITKKSGIIYRFKCNRVECSDEYIGESSRTFGERFREHLKAPFPVYDNYNITGHCTTIENFSIVGREDQNLIRAIKEAIYIRVNNPSINRNIGKYHLPHIWDEVLLNISELKLKKIYPGGHSICHMAITSAILNKRQKHLPKNIIFYMIAEYRQITSATSRHSISLHHIGYNSAIAQYVNGYSICHEPSRSIIIQVLRLI